MISFNPAISLICAFIYSLILSFSTFEFYFLIPLIFLIITNFDNLLKILKKLLFLNLFIFAIFVFVWIQNSLVEALNIYVRTNMIIFFNLLLFFNSKGLDIVRGFYLLKFPNRFVSTFYFTWKMIVELQDDFKNIKTTLITRSFHSKTNLFIYQTYGNILGLLFVKSIQKAQNLKDSFELRGFNGEIYLSDSFNLNKFDFYLIITVLITFIFKVFA